MGNTLRHIGLQVVEPDVQSFYMEVLQFSRVRSFDLSGDVAFDVFGIYKSVNVIFGECAEMTLELFVVDVPQQRSFGHCCFSSRRMAEIEKKAAENGYKTCCRGSVGNETLFICDSSNNVFEIKQLE